MNVRMTEVSHKGTTIDNNSYNKNVIVAAIAIVCRYYYL